ncbi:hypothetical protein ABZ330_30020 [Streptomyces sp. NPDC006172]|uniref:hypothetical protein n=1 Tax=Streptomyces sp. NPDC006172 TaxID=3154470 RepID=UPI0033D8B75D
MNAQRVRRCLAASAVGVLMAGGATVGAASTASAAAPAHPSPQVDRGWCDHHHRWWNDDCNFHDSFQDGSVVVIVVV